MLKLIFRQMGIIYGVSLLSLFEYFSLINVYLVLHPYTLVRPVCHGLLTTPRNMATKSPNTFNSAAPRTYNTICISSESCLGSTVGIARLPCFGALRSVISAKVAQGELVRLCPGSSVLAPH